MCVIELYYRPASQQRSGLFGHVWFCDLFAGLLWVVWVSHRLIVKLVGIRLSSGARTTQTDRQNRDQEQDQDEGKCVAHFLAK